MLANRAQAESTLASRPQSEPSDVNSDNNLKRQYRKAVLSGDGILSPSPLQHVSICALFMVRTERTLTINTYSRYRCRALPLPLTRAFLYTLSQFIVPVQHLLTKPIRLLRSSRCPFRNGLRKVNISMDILPLKRMAGILPLSPEHPIRNITLWLVPLSTLHCSRSNNLVAGRLKGLARLWHLTR